MLTEKTKAAGVSVLSNTILTLLKIIAGITMCSVSVLAEAVHSGIDLIASGVAFFAVHESDKPADEDHRYGHGKIECVSGMIEALLIFAAAGYIIFEVISKLRCDKFDVMDLNIGAAVMATSALVNLIVSSYLYKVAKKTESIALEADALHLRTDVYTSAGVLIGLIIIKFSGLVILDPIIAGIVALFILKAAGELARKALQDMLDTKLPEEEEKVILDVLEKKSYAIIEYHKLRTRKSGHTRYIDFHIVVSRNITVEESHRMSHEVMEAIEKCLPNSEILVHAEPCEAKCHCCPVGCIVQ